MRLLEQPDATQPIINRIMPRLLELGKLISTYGHGSNDPSIQRIDDTLQALRAEYEKQSSLRSGPVQIEFLGEKLYRDAVTALTLAYFASAGILLSLARHRDTEQISKTIEEYCQTILDSGQFLFKSQNEFRRSSLSMLFPIILVALNSTSTKQRSTASSMMRSRLQDASFKGLNWIAMETVSSVHTNGLRGIVEPNVLVNM